MAVDEHGFRNGSQNRVKLRFRVSEPLVATGRRYGQGFRNSQPDAFREPNLSLTTCSPC